MCSTATWAITENEKGNGCGGVIRNGRYMTFYSAQIYVEKRNLNLKQLPQLENLMSFFTKNRRFFTDGISSLFLNALNPTSTRRYYNVKKDQFTDEVYQRIISEYRKNTQVSERDELTLFAVTDTNSRTTYLLPSFYKLNPIEQQTVLFHEAYWIVYPHFDYKSVINAEIAMQYYLENPEDNSALLELVKQTGSRIVEINAAIMLDLQSNSLDGLLVKTGTIRGIELKTLFGESYFSCLLEGEDVFFRRCEGSLFSNIYRLRERYPHSLFLAEFLSQLEDEKVKIYYKRNIDFYGRIAGSLIEKDLFRTMDERRGYHRLDSLSNKDAKKMIIDDLSKRVIVLDFSPEISGWKLEKGSLTPYKPDGIANNYSWNKEFKKYIYMTFRRY